MDTVSTKYTADAPVQVSDTDDMQSTTSLVVAVVLIGSGQVADFGAIDVCTPPHTQLRQQ